MLFQAFFSTFCTHCLFFNPFVTSFLTNINDSRLSCPPPLRSISFSFPLFFPFPLRVRKSKLFCYWGHGLCNSNLRNRIARLNTSNCIPECGARVQVSRFTLLTSSLRVVERERHEGNYRGCYCQNGVVHQSSQVCISPLTGRQTNIKTLQTSIIQTWIQLL